MPLCLKLAPKSSDNIHIRISYCVNVSLIVGSAFVTGIRYDINHYISQVYQSDNASFKLPDIVFIY